MDSWLPTELGKLCVFQAGDAFSKDKQGAMDGDVPFIKVSDMNIPGNDYHILRAANWLTSAEAKSFRKHQSGATVFAKIGEALRANRRRLLTRPTIIDNNMMSATAGPDTDEKWLFYLLQTIDFNEVSRGSALPYLAVSDLKLLPELSPLKDEQTEIATALSSFDDKIELNRRMNETLEALAQAIFKDWFVDFGPTRRKSEGATDPVAILGNLIPDPNRATQTAALFPATFGDDGLPEGWRFEPVSEFGELSGGKQLDKSEIADEGSFPVFGGAGIMGFAERSNASGYVITVGRVGAYCGQFFAHRGQAWVNNNASLIKSQRPELAEWLFWALKNVDIDVIKKGAAQPFVSNSNIAKLSLVSPGLEILEQFVGLLRPLLLRGEACAKESALLAETRDYLLPRLMSGQVRVRDAENTVS